MDLSRALPPSPDADAEEHNEYAVAVLMAVEEIIQRVETPGFRIDISWSRRLVSQEGSELFEDDGGMGVTAFFCSNCAKLHKTFWIANSEGELLVKRDV